MGDPTSSYATAGIALMVSGALKPHHHDKVETPSVGNSFLGLINLNSLLKMPIPLWSRNRLDPNPWKSDGDNFTVVGYGIKH
jgi:hypothetical protein